MRQRRRRQHHLGRGLGRRLEELEVAGRHAAACACSLRDDLGHRRCPPRAAVGVGEGEVGLDALLAEAVRCSRTAPRGTRCGGTRRRVTACRPTRSCMAIDLADQPVLDRAQLRGWQLALEMRLARIAQLLRPDQAADMVGAKRGPCTLCHALASPCRPPRSVTRSRARRRIGITSRRTA